MEKENAIIIDGVKHVYVEVGTAPVCGTCSLESKCNEVERKTDGEVCLCNILDPDDFLFCHFEQVTPNTQQQ